MAGFPLQSSLASFQLLEGRKGRIFATVPNAQYTFIDQYRFPDPFFKAFQTCLGYTMNNNVLAYFEEENTPIKNLRQIIRILLIELSLFHSFFQRKHGELLRFVKNVVHKSMKNIAIFASGEGTNTQNIIDHFESPGSGIKVVLVVSNNPQANVLNRAKEAGIPSLIIDRDTFYSGTRLVEQLLAANIDLIVLAGFLWKIPENLIKNFPDKIINIHPALLPKFGGKGMYGINVHKAVVAAKEKQSGISIHFVNENYDEGQLIAQYTCSVDPSDTPETLAHKIHQLENEFFPKVIFNLLMSL